MRRHGFAAVGLALCSLVVPIGGARAGDDPVDFAPPPPAAHGASFAALRRSVSAEDPAQSEPRSYWRRNLFRRAVLDQKYLVVKWWPREFRRLDFSIPLGAATLLAAGASGSANSLDRRWEESFHDWATGGRENVARTLSTIGNPESAAVLLGGTYLIARWSGHTRMQRATSLSAEALLSAGLYASVLKQVAGRTRPAADGSGEFFVSNPADGQEVGSFPSGHATGAFSVAAVIAGEYHDKRWVGWVSYIGAGLIAASRVALGRHFPSDVIAGALIGRSLGRAVVRRERGEDGNPDRGRIEPLFDPAHGGVGLMYHRAW